MSLTSLWRTSGHVHTVVNQKVSHLPMHHCFATTSRDLRDFKFQINNCHTITKPITHHAHRCMCMHKPYTCTYACTCTCTLILHVDLTAHVPLHVHVGLDYGYRCRHKQTHIDMSSFYVLTHTCTWTSTLIRPCACAYASACEFAVVFAGACGCKFGIG